MKPRSAPPGIPVLLAAAVLVLLAPGLAGAADRPPVAPVENVPETHWGVVVDDPYRYMEDLKDERVRSWIKGQGDHASGVLDGLGHRDEILRRIEELDAGREWRVTKITPRAQGGLFYLKQKAGESVPKLYGVFGKGSERLIFDPTKRAPEGGGHFSISWFTPTPDGRRVALGLAANGTEDDELRVIDVVSGKFLPEAITRMEAAYTEPQWLPDGSGFFYSRLRELPPDAPATEGYKLSYASFHRLGTPLESDPRVFARGLHGGVDMAEEDFPSVVLTEGSPYAIGKIKHGDSNQLTLHVARLADLLAGTSDPWRPVCDVPDSVVAFAVHESTIDLVTSRGAPRFKVVRTDLALPSFSSALTIVPPGPQVIDAVFAAKDALYIQFQRGGIGSLGRLSYREPLRLEALPLPDGFPSAAYVAASSGIDGAWMITSAWTKAGRTYRYDPPDNRFVETGLNPVGRYDAVPGYASLELEVPSHDGVRVPLSIIYKEGVKRDGTNPTLLTAYGAYGSNRNVGFDPTRLAWLERGGVIAVAHVRGGGELGQEWHEAGQKLTKPNTWKDFIACGEWLVKSGWTSPGRLAGQGGSAGGITIGRAITERPDLFAAALIDVGSLDAVRGETTTNGVPNIMEFGTVKKEDEFRGLLEMSAYHHVIDGVKYPAVLLSHGLNDPRVEPWASAKMCARLQAATASDRPVLFRVDDRAGHGIGSTRSQRLSAQADKYAFLLWQMEAPGPLP